MQHWKNVSEVKVLIPGPKDARPSDLLRAYIGKKSGAEISDCLIDDLISNLEGALPHEICVTVHPRGESHHIHGVQVINDDGTPHRDVTGNLHAIAHALAREVLDALIAEFRAMQTWGAAA